MREIARLDVPFDEFRIWQQRIRPECEAAGAEPAALALLEHVCTEMLNNVVDHSASPDCCVELEADSAWLVLRIVDHGVGVFHRVATGLGLEAIDDALIELVKGKTTTDPSNHSGEGLFFSVRACDWFSLSANGYVITWTDGAHPQMAKYGNSQPDYGTEVKLKVAKTTSHNLRSLFDEFCPAPDNHFSKTVVPLGVMFKAQGGLVSRSQGKRAVHGLNRFVEVTFDFADVPQINQGFADEVFRVWRQANPGINIAVTNAADDVRSMLRHVGFTA